MKAVLGMGSSFSMSASPFACSCALSERLQTKDNAPMTKGFIIAFDTPEMLWLHGGCCDRVFIFYSTVFVRISSDRSIR